MRAQPDYRIYPSLLISYQSLLDYELVAEEDWNKVTQTAHDRGEYLDREIGDYKLTPDEMYLKLECDLLDSINRIDGEYSEAASKGTAFNEIVDCLIENRKSSREDCKIYSTYTDRYFSVLSWPSEYKTLIGEDKYKELIRLLEKKEKVIRAEIDGFTFDYDVRLCKETASQFPGSIPQYLANAVIETKFGNVYLYGYIDEWCGSKMYDIKTTSRYSWGKFEHGWQRYVYPWCVIESCDATEVESFTYYVIEWAYQAKGEPLTAKGIYKEEYTYNHDEATVKIRDMVESFLSWVESRREFIQDKRIFGGVNPEGWHGQPTDIKKLEKVIFKEIA